MAIIINCDNTTGSVKTDLFTISDILSDILGKEYVRLSLYSGKVMFVSPQSLHHNSMASYIYNYDLPQETHTSIYGTAIVVDKEELP